MITIIKSWYSMLYCVLYWSWYWPTFRTNCSIIKEDDFEISLHFFKSEFDNWIFWHCILDIKWIYYINFRTNLFGLWYLKQVSMKWGEVFKVNIHLRIFVWFDNCWKLPIFCHVLDIFSALSNRIKLIPFHERSASHGTSLEYHQQGSRSNLKIHFFRLRGVLRGP